MDEIVKEFIRVQQLNWFASLIKEKTHWPTCRWELSVSHPQGTMTAFVNETIVFQDMVSFTDFPGTLVTININDGVWTIGECHGSR